MESSMMNTSKQVKRDGALRGGEKESKSGLEVEANE